MPAAVRFASMESKRHTWPVEAIYPVTRVRPVGIVSDGRALMGVLLEAFHKCVGAAACGRMARNTVNPDAGVVIPPAPAIGGQRKFRQFRQTHGPQTFETRSLWRLA